MSQSTGLCRMTLQAQALSATLLVVAGETPRNQPVLRSENHPVLTCRATDPVTAACNSRKSHIVRHPHHAAMLPRYCLRRHRGHGRLAQRFRIFCPTYHSDRAGPAARKPDTACRWLDVLTISRSTKGSHRAGVPASQYSRSATSLRAAVSARASAALQNAAAGGMCCPCASSPAPCAALAPCILESDVSSSSGRRPEPYSCGPGELPALGGACCSQLVAPGSIL